MHPSLTQTDHRPWPLPGAAWVWRQSWVDLCFIHYRVTRSQIAPLLPAGLELDTYDGQVWIGVVPFRMEDVSRRGLPAVLGLGDFPELNIRTYVTCGGKPGVWFFSLDAGNSLAVWGGRRFFDLPYHRAAFSIRRRGDEFDYSAVRGDRRFAATFSAGQFAPSTAGSFEHWATERYCLYAVDGARRLHRVEVHHPKWPLQEACVDIRENSRTDVPLVAMHRSVLFSKRVDVVAWPKERVP